MCAYYTFIKKCFLGFMEKNSFNKITKTLNLYNNAKIRQNETEFQGRMGVRAFIFKVCLLTLFKKRFVLKLYLLMKLIVRPGLGNPEP